MVKPHVVTRGFHKETFRAGLSEASLLGLYNRDLDGKSRKERLFRNNEKRKHFSETPKEALKQGLTSPNCSKETFKRDVSNKKAKRDVSSS